MQSTDALRLTTHLFAKWHTTHQPSACTLVQCRHPWWARLPSQSMFIPAHQSLQGPGAITSTPLAGCHSLDGQQAPVLARHIPGPVQYIHSSSSAAAHPRAWGCRQEHAHVRLTSDKDRPEET
jgi:hypothetical protein